MIVRGNGSAGANTGRLRRPSADGDRGTGVFGTMFGFLVFFLFLLFAVQLLFGLYARTTVTAVATDLAQRAANDGATLDESRLADYESEGRRRLGRYGAETSFRFALVDRDADGTDDAVAVSVTAPLPQLLPVARSIGPTSVTRTMYARIEVFQE